MPTIKKKKRSTVENDIDERDMEEEYANDYEQPRVVQKNPNYIMIGLLMAVSFFAGYLLSKNIALQKSLNDAKAQPVAAAGAQQAPPTSVDIAKIKPLFGKDNIHFGDNNRKVLIVEITDPSCPFCHIAGGLNPELSKQANFQYTSDGGSYTPPVPEIRKLVDEGKASFAIVYGTGHGAGHIAAEAMYCANDKGNFWPVHDRLMSNEGYDLLNNQMKDDRSKSQMLVDFLSQETDASALKDCIDNKKYAQKIVDDEQQIDPGLGFQGTPHFVINGKIVNGAHDWKDLKSIIDSI